MSRTPSGPGRAAALPCVAALLIACAASGCGAAGTRSGAPRVVLEAPAMGTLFRVVVEVPPGRTADEAREAARAALAAVEAVESWASDWRSTSEVSRLAAELADGGGPVAASPELTAHVAFALDLARETDGAFDPTLGRLTRLWRRTMRRAELPDPERLADALASSGFQHVQVDVDASSVSTTRPGLRFDLGGSAKGEALDRAQGVLAELGFSRALVDGGGDLRLGRAPTGAVGWAVVVRAAGDEVDALHLELAECAVATSGDAARFVEIEGRRYSHVLDPETGTGLERRRAATVIAPDGRTADALATALVVEGAAGLRWVEARPQCEGRVVEWGRDGPLPCNSSGFPQDGATPSRAHAASSPQSR